MLPDLPAYERFVYTLQQSYPSVRQSTLVVVRRVIQGYSYAVNRGVERLYWYDPQPHPNDPTLAATFPHHKHVPPNIKHYRVPAPGLSFTRPNLPVLIAEIEHELLHL